MNTYNQAHLSKLLTLALDGRLMSEYASNAGVSLTYVSELIRQERTNPPQPKTLKKLAIAARGIITYEELMQAAGHFPSYPSGTSDEKIFGKVTLKDTENGCLIPIVGAVHCGPGGVAYEEPQGQIAVGSGQDHLFALYCKGQSMTGLGIFEGDIAIIEPQTTIRNGDLAVVVIEEEEGTLKKFYKKDKMIILEAANPDYPTRILTGSDLDHFYIVGKVIETRRRW